MKNIIKTCLGAAALLLAISANAWSLPYPVSVGDLIKVNHVDTVAQYEGEYQVNSLTNGSKFGSFCLELNENISSNGTIYTVQSIENYAVAGGFGGASGGQDPLSGATKWLYANFLLKNIAVATGVVENDWAMQLAFWKLEDELNTTTSLSYYNQYEASPFAKAYVAAALANGANGDIYDVKVINLVTADGKLAQSQLVGAVPEPGTIVLLGSGLLGLVIFGKRRMNHKS